MRGDSHILPHGHLAEWPDDLVRADDSSLHHRMIRKAFDAFASEPDLAGCRLERADQAGKERRLAGAIGSDDPEDVARHHVEVDQSESE